MERRNSSPLHRSPATSATTAASSERSRRHGRCPAAARPAPPRSRVARHAWLAVLAIGSALFLATERTLAATGERLLLPSAMLLGATTVPVACLAFVWGRRLRCSVGLPLVTCTAVIGGVVATVVAGAAEFAVREHLGDLPVTSVGLVEEASKLLVPLAVLLLVGRRRTAADGLLLGVAAGVGFAALETTGYAFAEFEGSRGDLADTVDVLALRGLLSPAGHIAWTGIAVTALFAAASSGWRPRPVAAAVGACALAVALHTAWDAPLALGGSSGIGRAVVAVVGLGTLCWMAHRASGPGRDRARAVR